MNKLRFLVRFTSLLALIHASLLLSFISASMAYWCAGMGNQPGMIINLATFLYLVWSWHKQAPMRRVQ